MARLIVRRGWSIGFIKPINWVANKQLLIDPEQGTLVPIGLLGET
jgi:hypothetical protein